MNLFIFFFKIITSIGVEMMFFFVPKITLAKVSKIGLLGKYICLWYRYNKVTYTVAQYSTGIIRNKEVIQISPEKNANWYTC